MLKKKNPTKPPPSPLPSKLPPQWQRIYIKMPSTKLQIFAACWYQLSLWQNIVKAFHSRCWTLQLIYSHTKLLIVIVNVKIIHIILREVVQQKSGSKINQNVLIAQNWLLYFEFHLKILNTYSNLKLFSTWILKFPVEEENW